MRLGVVVAVSAVVLVAGCGGKSPEPAPYQASRSASASTTSSPTEDAKASAQAFVLSYFDAFAKASNSGDTSKLRAYGASGCDSCAQVVKAIEKTYRDGGYARGVTYTLSEVVVRESGAATVVKAAIALGPQTLALSSAAPEQTIAPSRDRVTVRLGRSNGNWVITEWTRE